MNKPRIFPKSMKMRGQFLKWVNLETFQLYDFDLYLNHLKTCHSLFTKGQQTEITLVFVPTSIFTFPYPSDIQ